MMKTVFGQWSQAPNGLLVLQLSKYALIGGTAKNAPRFYRIRLDGSGAIPTGQQMVANDQIMPEGTQYQATLYDVNSNIVFGPQMVTICGPDPINLNQVIVASSTTSQISVSLSPNIASLQSGQIQQFTPTVANTSNHNVTWATTLGTITATGLYTAPTVTTATAVTVAATSVADPTKSASVFFSVLAATATSVRITPGSATLAASATQQFTATVTPSTIDQTVTWSAINGTITSTGLFTAANVTSATTAVVTATSVADPTASVSVNVSISAPVNVTVVVSPQTTTLTAGGSTVTFTAVVSGIADHSVTWSAHGGGTGQTSSSPAVGTVNSTTGVYTPPASLAVQSFDAVVATAVGYPSSSGFGIVTVNPNVSVSVGPTGLQLAVGETQQFTATVVGTSNHSVTWSAQYGTITAAGLYTAPATATLDRITAISVPFPGAIGQVSVSVIAASAVTVVMTPVGEIVLNAGQTQQFSAVVQGITDQNVTWSLRPGSTSVPVAGTISATGFYTTPASLAAITYDVVVATSVGYPSAQGFVGVQINPVSPTQLDLVQWSVSSQRTTQHLVGDPHAPYSVQMLDTDSGYPAGYPKGLVWQIKNKLGHPWDIRRYDANYIYHWITENGDSVDNPACQTANGTTCWLYSRAYKRFLTPLRGWPRYLTPNAPPVTIDSVGPNTTNRTVDCEAHLTGVITLGDVRTVTSGPTKYTWGGSIDSGAGSGANGPTLDSVHGVDTVVNLYYYSGTIAANDFKDREEYYYVLGFGEVAWYYYHRTSATAPWTWVNQTVNSTLASGGTPAPSFPCGAGKTWWV